MVGRATPAAQQPFARSANTSNVRNWANYNDSLLVLRHTEPSVGAGSTILVMLYNCL